MNKKTVFFIFLFLILTLSIRSFALDTDIYKANVRPNVVILFDNSDSMDFGVYEYTVDYGAFYNWASDQGDCDLIAGGGCGTNNYFYPDSRKYPRNEILLVKGNIRVTVRNGRSYTGDPGDPDYGWYIGNVIHTYTEIDSDGNLQPIAGHTQSQRITTDAEGNILLDGEPLPLDRSIKLHNWQSNPDGTLIDKGFGGLLNAPGWYFSGFEGIGGSAAGHDVAEDGDIDVYFFIPGNWINMQMVYNLYTQNCSCPSPLGYPCEECEEYRTWKVRTFPNQEWSTVSTDIHTENYPGNYTDGHDETWTITQADASKINIHFEDFEVEEKNHGNCKDYLKIYKDGTQGSNLLDTFCGDKGEFWTGSYDLGDNHNLILKFHSNNSINDKGFKIDKYKYVTSGEYKMQRRLDVTRDAMLYVIDQTRGKINWGLAAFNNGDGAKIMQPLNPTLSDDAMRQNLVTHLNQLEPQGGTPLGEALQDVYNHYKSKENILPYCSKNYVITISDGYPSDDEDWSRISGKTFTDEDGDGWTEDPYQYTNPPDDYMDDVGHWMYTHSIKDGSQISDPSSSYENIVTHTLGFCVDAPIMEDTAEDSNGMFLAAFNKQQLVNALYSLGLVIVSNVSYVAPVISIDVENKTQSGDRLYMAFFKPKAGRWTGNLKKYGLAYKVKSNSDRAYKEWVVVDSTGEDATDCNGTFLETSISYWSSGFDGGEVDRGGLGGVLKNAIDNATLSNPYSYRDIYVIGNDGNKTEFTPSNIANVDLGVSSDSDRYKVINYVYGYTYDEDNSTNHYPKARRPWILANIIHSSPTIINYEGDNKTFVAVGANDGMLHVFDNSDGSEKVAFIPENLLNKLQDMNPTDTTKESPLFYVDGAITCYYTFDSDGHIVPELLIFGERRGGKDYYALDITNSDPAQWTLKWHINNTGDFAELGQSWSKMQFVKLKTGSADKIIAVFCGGYDPEEDKDKPGSNTMGRAIYVIDAATGSEVYSYTFGDNSDMKYCIPSDPTIVTDKYDYLTDIFFADIGGQIWRVSYNATTYAFETPEIIFKSNPGSADASGNTGGTFKTPEDSGRKMFYSPAVTLKGDCLYTNGKFDSYYLFVGTGDREHPLKTTVNNRIYSVLVPDDTTYHLDERNLLNVTDDELDVDSGATNKNEIRNKLTDSYGWYIKLGDIDFGTHTGEKILSQPVLFYKIAYFTSFTPVTDDPCEPHGEAKVYALKYCDGTSALNYNPHNDAGGATKYDKTDRYRAIGESIPSGVKIVIREGKAGAFITVGGKIVGVGEEGSSKIPQPSFAIHLIDWRKLLE